MLVNSAGARIDAHHRLVDPALRASVGPEGREAVFQGKAVRKLLLRAAGKHWLDLGPVGIAADVMERDAAVQAVEEQLERDYQQWRAVTVDAMRLAVVHVEEHELVWIVSWPSEEFIRTRNSRYMLVGEPFPLLQAVWPNRDGAFPRQPGGEDLLERQPCLWLRPDEHPVGVWTQDL
ncbi:YrhB domain-containing protein [Streptomyces sp. NPDC058287]|uniref:YrhB domain-containing protein n=1 Tax=Streptomyces sp. NPDC058287 TaxID=3346423 RepID=UPI0036E53CE1